MIKILKCCFSILFGIGIGLFNFDKYPNLFAILESVYLTANKIIDSLVYILPFALLGSLATEFAAVDIDILLAIAKFSILIMLIYFIVFMIGNMVIVHYTKQPISEVIKSVGKLSMIALATQSIIECVPSSVSIMINDFLLNRRMINLVVPLGLTIFRYGNQLN